MKTIAIVSQKGRAGETTLVLHLACAAQAGGFQSAIVDLDSQASAAAWHDSGEAEAPVVAALPYTRLAQGLEAARKGGAALVAVDTAPHPDAAAAAPAGILDLRAIDGDEGSSALSSRLQALRQSRVGEGGYNWGFGLAAIVPGRSAGLRVQVDYGGLEAPLPERRRPGEERAWFLRRALSG